MCRPMHRQLMRNELLDLAPIIPATPCHQSNYIETYSRCMHDLVIGLFINRYEFGRSI